MGNLFSKHKGPKGAVLPPVTEADQAVLQLKTQRLKLRAQRSRLEELVKRQVEVIRELVAQRRKERALLALRQKRLREAQIDRIDAYLLNVEQVLINIEDAQRSHKLFEALKQGNAALRGLQQELPLGDVEKLMEDTAEAKEYEERVRDLLAQSTQGEEEAAALEELEALEAAQAREDAGQLPAASTAAAAGKLPPGKAPAAKEGGEALEPLPSVPTDRKVPLRQPEAARERREEPLAA